MKTSIIHSNKRASSLKHGVLTVTFLFLVFTSQAQETEDPNKTLSPYFMVMSNDPGLDQLPLKNTNAEVNIAGVIADVTISQVYKNEGQSPLEAIYTFPVSCNAAVYAMEMVIGDRKIVAKIEEKEKARAGYEKAKSEGRRTSLLEQQRPNVFQMNVANIMPGDVIKVCLKYTELLVPENSTYQFVYPTVVGPRYSNQTAQEAGSSDGFVSSPYQKAGHAPAYDFSIVVNLHTGMPIQHIICPTHKTNIIYPATGNAVIELDPSETVGGNRDFVLNYQLAGDKIESGLLLYKHSDENFFLLMVQPPKRIVKEEIPPREYIFIVDVSGSMRGFPLNVSKTLLRNLVVNLKPTDMFNVLVFSGSSGWLSDQSVPANSTNIDRAVGFIDNQQGGGGTELLPALQKALSFPRQSASLSRSFVLVTDGYVNIEKEAFDLIRKNCDNANTFAFGIGSSVNRYLIEGIANAGQSEPMIILDPSDAAAKAEKFRKYINSPVLTQIKKEFNGFDACDVEPLAVPDVLAERPVIIFGKYRGEAKGTITIKGMTGSGQYKKTFKVVEAKPDQKNSALRYLWARKRIQLLDDYQSASNSNEGVKEVTDLGLKYNLMTAYTSFLAVEEDRVVNEGTITSVKQVLPMPEGVPNSAVGFEMEVDEEEASLIFYKDIQVLGEMQADRKESILKYIESQFQANFSPCLASGYAIIELIQVTVDEKGKVIHVIVHGERVSPELEKCIAGAADKMNFSGINAGKEFKFEIIF